MYVKKDAAKGVIIICLYVDDLLITGSNESYISEFKGDLKEEFENDRFRPHEIFSRH